MKTSLPLLFFSFFFTSLWFDHQLCFSKATVDEFQACRDVYYNCGELVNITYPFWGNEREDFCGRGPFRLVCKDNETTTIEINSMEFNVLSINQTDHRMRIARSDLFDDSCPKTQIETATLEQSQFKYSSNDRNISVWYGCPPGRGIPENFRFWCGSEGERNESVNYAWENEAMQVNLSAYTKECKITIEVTVTAEVLEKGKKNRATLVETALREGFEVEYGDLYAVACDGCKESGGTCGGNSTHGFNCICKNRDVHPFVCQPPHTGTYL